eukprot:gene6332-6819_t
MAQFEGVLNPIIWKDSKYLDQVEKDYITSQPYQHSVLKPLCEPDFLKKVHDEITNNMKANFKETDLFKVFQTAELGSIEEETLEKEMPSLLKLRKVLYSKEWRQIVSKMMNCNEELGEILTDRVDCSINAYANSCHLLCHDDVIGTRCVSYIIYLPNPDEEWKAEDGGAVELYPLDPASIVTTDVPYTKQNSDSTTTTVTVHQEQGIPVTNPTNCLLPTFNSMLIFKVKPGKSYHSVQEVFNKSSPRLSISGWYHASQPPIGSDSSSLKLIMKYGDEQQQSIQPLPTTTPSTGEDNLFNEEEKTFLKKYINIDYLKIKNLKKLQKEFINNSSIRLQEFLNKSLYHKILSKIIIIDHFHDKLGKGKPSLDYTIGIKDGWNVLGPAHKRRYLSYQPSSSSESSDSVYAEVGKLLDQLKTELFTHPAFVKFLSMITTIDVIKGIRSEVRRFRPGFDYTVAHYGIITREPWLDINLCFVNDDKEVEEQIIQSYEDSEGNNKKDNKKRKKENKKISLKSLKKKKTSAKQQARDNDDDDNEEEEEVNEKGEGEDDGYASDYGDLWEDGDVGGFECFIEADNDADDAEAAEVYRQKKDGEEGGGEAEDDTTLLSLSAYSNALSLVLRDEGIMKFVKYVSANAPGSRWDVSAEYQIEHQNDEDDEDDDDQEDENEDGDDDEEDEEEED